MGAERWLCSSCGATSDPAPEPPPGCARCDAPLHVGKYCLIAELDPEPAIRVFRARESFGPAEVAIRILQENLPPSIAELRHSMKRTSALSHPIIAKPLDAGMFRGRPYLVEETASGSSILKADLTLREAMGVLRDAALALDAAHELGIVHPDLRADSLRVVRAGSSLDGSGWKVRLTGFSVPAETSVRANLQSFGRILYRVATGRDPSPSVSAASLNPLVDTVLESIIQMSMDSSASSQPPGAGEIAAELTRWLKGDAPAVKPKTVRILPSDMPSKSFDWSRIRPEARIAAGVALALLVLVLYFALRSPSPDPAPAPKIAEARAEAAQPQPPPPPPPPKVEEPKPPPPPPPEPPKPAPKIEEPKPVVIEPPKPEPKIEEPKPVVVEPPKPLPKAEEPKPPPPPPPDPPKPAPKPWGVLGSVHGAHPEYGVFVKLEIKVPPAAGEELEAVRDGKAVARLAVTQITAADKRYPMGCAVCKIVSGSAAAGDFVRRIAK